MNAYIVVSYSLYFIPAPTSRSVHNVPQGCTWPHANACRGGEGRMPGRGHIGVANRGIREQTPCAAPVTWHKVQKIVFADTQHV